jgi:hypothetical protein
MSATLVNDNGKMWTGSSAAWDGALMLAGEHDWRGEGTCDPLQPGSALSWKGSYSLNNGQRVVDTDAKAIADALDAALADSPDSPDEGWLLSGAGRAHLRNLIEFCREGSFRVF